MLLLLHAQQSVTVPRLCLNQSRFVAQKMFLRMLKDAVGFEVVEMKETPKNFMCVLKKPLGEEGDGVRASARERYVREAAARPQRCPSLPPLPRTGTGRCRR